MDKINKILTVVVPTYNMEKYLRRCLDSLIVSDEQMQQLEVLVINDGSKDGSSQIAHDYQNRYPQTFRVIDKENGNYGSCVNRGLKEAEGKYIKILDADDWFDNSIFVRYVALLRTLDVDLVINNRMFVHDDLSVVEKVLFPLPKCKVFNFYDYRVSVCMHDIAYKTSNVRKLNYHQTEGISYTDCQWCYIPTFNVRKAYYTKEWMYMYLVGREGQTMDKSVRLKSMSHWQGVLGGMMEAFCKMDIVEEGKSFCRERLMESIDGFYKKMLIHYKIDNSDVLVSFDKFFHDTYPDLYESSQNELVLSRKWNLKYKYVKKWRENKRMNYRHPLVALYIIYQDIKNSDKKYD